MYITEMFDTPAGHRTEKDDHTTLGLKDLRKTRLTLEQINRLRIMNDVRKLEHEQKLTRVHRQYAAAGAAAGGPGGMGAPATL